MSQTKQANIFRSLGRGISKGVGSAGDFLGRHPKATAIGAPLAGAGLAGGALAMGAPNPVESILGPRGGGEEPEAPDMVERLREGAVGGINNMGDRVSSLFGDKGAIGGLFQEGGALGGIGNWWRGLSPEAQKAILYSAIAGGAGLGGYGLYKAFGGGSPEPRMAY